MAFPIRTMQWLIIPGLTLPKSHHNWGWNSCQRKSQMKEDHRHILRMLNDAENMLYRFDLEIQKAFSAQVGITHACELKPPPHYKSLNITELYCTVFVATRRPGRNNFQSKPGSKQWCLSSACIAWQNDPLDQSRQWQKENTPSMFGE